MKPLLTHREAQREIAETLEWYEKNQSGTGFEFLDEYETALHRIQADPAQSAHHSIEPYRYVTLRRFPFCVCFVEFEDLIWIAAVPHHKRDTGYWQSRTTGDP